MNRIPAAGVVCRKVVSDDVDFPFASCVTSTSARQATNSALIWCKAVSRTTCPPETSRGRNEKKCQTENIQSHFARGGETREDQEPDWPSFHLHKGLPRGSEA